jgi:hypothetical protein
VAKRACVFGAEVHVGQARGLFSWGGVLRCLSKGMRFRPLVNALLYRARLAKSSHGVAPLNLSPPGMGLQPIPACALNRA